MSRVYDNWDRLVGATLLREELRLIAQRTPSDLSLASSRPSPSRSPSPSPSPSLSSSSMTRSSFTYDQMLRATNNFIRSNWIMCARTGDLFTGVLEDGTRVLVKQVDFSLMHMRISFTQELEFYSKVSHPRFVPLLGHCLENKIHKFLVYKYMPHMDLHRFCSTNVNSDLLSWHKRLKIARGVAEGLCYLHHECDPPLVHRNINAGSILLDNDFEVRLGRLSEVCAEVKETNQNMVSRALQLKKNSESTSGTSTSTCAFDVYCFGKVLLYLVTGDRKLRLPYLETMMNDCMVENTLSYISSLDKKLILNIVDRSLLIDHNLLMEVWAVAFVAKACLHPKPSKRPEMSYVLEALRNPATACSSW